MVLSIQVKRPEPLKRPEPRNSKEVEMMLGLFQFFRRFIPDFAENSKCLYNLVKKET